MKPLLKTTLLAGVILMGGAAYATSDTAEAQKDQTTRQLTDHTFQSRFEKQTILPRRRTRGRKEMKDYESYTPEETQFFTPKEMHDSDSKGRLTPEEGY